MPNNINISDYEKIIFVNNISEENSVVKNRNYNFAVFFTNDTNIPVNWPETAWGSTIRNIWYGGQRLNRFIGIDKDNCTLNVGDHTVKLTFDYDKGLLGISDTNKLESIEILKLSYTDAYNGLDTNITFSNTSNIQTINSKDNKFYLTIRFHVLEESGADVRRIANSIIIKCESNNSNLHLLNYVNEEIKDNGLTAERKYLFEIIYDTEVNNVNNKLYTVIPSYDNNITDSKNLILRLNPTSFRISRKNGSNWTDDLLSNKGILSSEITEEYKVDIYPNNNAINTYPTYNNYRKLYLEVSSSNGNAVTISGTTSPDVSSTSTLAYFNAGTNFNLVLHPAPDNGSLSSTITVTLKHRDLTENTINPYNTNLSQNFIINITGRTQITQYTVTFNGNSGTVNGNTAITVNEGSRIGTLPSATRSGYNFVGWFTTATGGSQVSASYTVNSDLTLYAHWTEIPQYTVTFNGNGGNSSTSEIRVNGGSQIGSLPSASRAGYTFMGWYTAASGGSQISASTVITGNITYYAHWDAIPVTQYTVTFDGNGGSISGSTTRIVDEGTQVGTLPSVSRSGYTYKGWYTAASGGTEISASTVINGNITFYAHWEAIPQYTITFDGNGGSISGSTTRTIQAGSQLGTLPSVSRSGYTLKGWYTSATGGSQISSSTVINGNATYYAQWDAIPVTQYIVSFNANGGTSTPSSITAEAGQTITLPAAISRNADSSYTYTFAGWNTSSNENGTNYNAGASYTVNGNIILYAKWNRTAKPVQSYYWYAGAGPITSMTIPGSDDKWHAISGNPTSVETGELSNGNVKINWVLAIPTDLGLNHISNGILDVTSGYDISTVVCGDGVEYTVFTQISQSKKTDRIFVP